MRFGVAISTSREGLFYPVGFTTPQSLADIAQKAEELGYMCVWGNDHIATQSYIMERGDHPNFYEPLVAFSYLSGLTKRIRFGTAVIVGPMRNPVILAKQAITLDHLSKGRFILGIGLGAYREEFEAFGGTGNRGKILDEMLKALAVLFSNEESVSFNGEFFRFKNLQMFPKPYSRPFPLYVGGNSPEVLRRVSEFGQGWIPASMSPEDIERSRTTIAEHAQSLGRDPSEIQVAPEGICAVAHDSVIARRTFVSSLVYGHLLSLSKSTLKDIPLNEEELVKRNIVGSPSEIIHKLEAYERVGVDHMWFDFLGSKPDEVIEQMKLFSKEVMPSF